LLVFITSLRHPWNCHSYRRVCALLDRSLKSVCRQTHPDYRVIVVCNELPRLTPHERIEYVEVNFPAPSDRADPHTGMNAIRLDRGSKYIVGASVARKYAPRHVMFFDADDLVSNRIAQTVNHGPEQMAWVFNEGYQFRMGSDRCLLKKDFYKLCGTSFVHPLCALKVPGGIEHDTSLEEVLRSTSQYSLRSVFGSHRNVMDHYTRALVRPVTPLPYPGAIWVLNTGENHSGRVGARGDLPVTPNMKDEFGIPDDWLA
jgi:hypothetical protein